MSEFTFHNPTLVRRFGTLLVVGTSVLLIVLTLVLTNIARSKYAGISDQLDAIAMAERAAQPQAGALAQNTFYVSDTPQLAQAQMQSDMQALADEYQVRLEVIRADQVEPLNGSLRLALTLNGVVQENELGSFLESLASHDPMIVVDSISLRRARSNNRNADERPLAIQLKLSGFASQ